MTHRKPGSELTPNRDKFVRRVRATTRFLIIFFSKLTLFVRRLRITGFKNRREQIGLISVLRARPLIAAVHGQQPVRQRHQGGAIVEEVRRLRVAP